MKWTLSAGGVTAERHQQNASADFLINHLTRSVFTIITILSVSRSRTMSAVLPVMVTPAAVTTGHVKSDIHGMLSVT
jgi:phosphoserine aminotransferase